VKTLDFGIAKLLDRVTTAPAPPASAELPTLPLPRAELRAGAPGPITRADTIIGTPHYMSPEQWRGEDLDGRADIYSLGVLAYRMLSGRMPFDGSPAELMRQHLYQQASPRPLLERRVPPAAADLVLRCLAKTPGERPRSAEELAAALRARAEGLGAVMRRVLAMGSEHSPSFLQISTIAHVPAMVALVFALGLSILSATLDPPPALRTAMVVVPCALFFLTGLFATSFSTGVFVPVLARLSARPLAAVPIMPLILLLRPLRYRLMRAALLFYAAALPSKLLLLVPLVLLRGAPAPWLLVPLLLLASAAGMWNTVRYALHAHAVVVEGLAGRAALRRSAELVSRAGKNIRGATALFASIVVFDLMALATCVVIVRSLDHGVALAIAQGSLLILPILAGVVLFVVTSILANPLLGLSFAMVYLRTRQSDGEALDRILGDRFLR